ncbi:MAG: ATP-binding cassette domain-containing protein [Gammaproteobacteria bacterium]|nr:ATP-binding cassette domain-containing protein [Gammaproteobacteria bacterium]MYF02626.1 ATP-binding cassette domain-containing protein [Gammaproteobacteria bacterium]MYI77697.1 ATP-binding cassette domain-containing protein [Gammaproteobacteria bacterium]
MVTESERNDWQTYGRLTSYVRSRAWYFVIALLAFFLAAIAEVFFAQILGSVVSSFEASSDTSASDIATNTAATKSWFWIPNYFLDYVPWPIPILFACMIGVAAFVRALSNVVGEFLLSRVSFFVVHTIRCELHDRLLLLPCSYFDESRQGDISNRLTDTTSKLRDTATEVLRILMQDGGKLMFMLGAMLLINLWLTLLFFVLAPIVAVIVHYASRRFRELSIRIQSSMGEVTHFGQETVLLHKTIRAYGAQQQQSQAFQDASTKNRQQHLKMVATKATSAQFIQLLVAFAIAALVGVLFIDQIKGGMDAAGIITYIGLAGALASPIKRLSDLNARLQIGLAAASEIFDHIDRDTELDNGREELQATQAAIQFNHVDFSYQNSDKQTLTDISVDVAPGQTLAIVGATGAGKTTLIQLLLRFYEPESGQILLNDEPLSSYTKDSLRNHIAFVSQEVVLFNDTIRNNIAFGRLRNSTPEQIESAVQRARVDIFTQRMQNGLDSNVGDRGTNLSQGERQRILIARAILKDAPVLILDEATSSLDTESERLIQAALDEMMLGRTTLVVAHRLSTVINADIIAVLEHGRIVELGSHQELLAKQGRYATLHASQFRNAE